MPYQMVVREVKKSPVGMGVVVDENNLVRGQEDGSAYC